MNEGFLNAVLSIATSAIGMFGVAMGLEGFFRGPISVVGRLLAIIGGLLLIYPGLLTDVIGVVAVGAIVAYRLLRSRQSPAAP